jgi:hypothetical protein
MTLMQMVAVALVAAAVWFLWDHLRARESANHAMRAACQARGLLFLDDTVALRKLRPGRDDNGRLVVRRTFDFAYSDSGHDRRGGRIVMLGTQVEALELAPGDGPAG